MSNQWHPAFPIHAEESVECSSKQYDAKTKSIYGNNEEMNQNSEQFEVSATEQAR